MLEAFAADESLKATQRLRAVEEIGKIESRRRMAEGRSPERGPEFDAEYPMTDLREAERVRRTRLRARESRRVA
jgi:hypothetical protein